MLDNQNPTTSTANPFAPYPDEMIQRHADAAATALINRYTLAKRTMEALELDADNATALAAFNEVAKVTHDMHRLLMLGWWTDQPF